MRGDLELFGEGVAGKPVPAPDLKDLKVKDAEKPTGVKKSRSRAA